MVVVVVAVRIGRADVVVVGFVVVGAVSAPFVGVGVVPPGAVVGRPLSRKTVLAVFHAQGTYDQIGARFGVCPSGVGNIKTGRAHRQVTGLQPPVRKVRYLTKETVEAILEGKDTYKKRAQRLGVSVSTIRKYIYAQRHRESRGPLRF